MFSVLANEGRIHACIQLRGGQFARFVRDEKPTRQALLAYLEAPQSGCFFELLKAGLLREVEGRVEWSPEFLSEDGQIIRCGNAWFWLDTGEVRTF